MSSSSQNYTTKLLTGEALRPLIPFLVQQRVTIFRAYPYLYEADLDEEQAYVASLVNSKQSAVAVAYFHGEPVGFVSALPFEVYGDNFPGAVELFKKHGKNPSQYYYIDDVVILPEHQGKSLLPQLIRLVEEYASSQGFAFTCFVSESHEQHPMKPLDYRQLEPMWRHFGYEKAGIILYYNWNTIQVAGPAIEQVHELPYWIKKLNH